MLRMTCGGVRVTGGGRSAEELEEDVNVLRAHVRRLKLLHVLQMREAHKVVLRLLFKVREKGEGEGGEGGGTRHTLACFVSEVSYKAYSRQRVAPIFFSLGKNSLCQHQPNLI